MGEVYKAKDTRLDRTVAIKVLPEHLSSQEELRQRFEREAKAISGLNHPNICTLYDVHLRQGSGGQVGSPDDIDYMVMELIEGETLAERLRTGPLPLDKALEVGAQIADALDKAHGQGVVHRDLKPGNVMLSKAGAKLLDFGLAKQHGAAGPDDVSGLSALPTEAKALTQKGSLLGTFQYMAPEQLEGGDATPRTDIFALGAVLYEMVTGRKAFGGKSTASLVTAIMSSEPPAPSTVQSMTPPALDAVVRTCLAKDPDERWQSAGDVGRQLKWIAEGRSQPDVVAAPAAKRHAPRPLLVGLTSLVVGAMAAGALM